MIETPTLRSPYSLKQNSQFFSPLKSVGPHESPSSNRFKTPIRVRKLESQREMHTEILQISQYSPDSSSQASKLPSITPVNRKRLSKRTLSNIESSVFKDNGKSMITIKDDKVIPISKLLSIQTEESVIVSSPSRKARVTLKPIETRRKRDVSGGGRDGNGSLSPRSMERISEHLKLESFVNRDIAEVMEPIAQQNSQKVKKINKMISERDGGMGKSPKSKFEEEIFDAVKRRFIRDKLESELRVIKPMHSEKFTLAAREEAYFKLSTRNLKFPLQGKILSKASTSSYEIFASTKATKPRLGDCEYHFTGNKFLIETQARIDCIYFTLLAITDLEAKLWILPDTGRKISEEDGLVEQSPSNIMRESPTEIIQNVPENLKNKYVRLYPFVSYTPDQMEDFVGEIKQLKAEREVKTRKLAKEERNIIASNTDGVKKFNKGQLLEKIREFNKIKKEVREVIVERRDKMEYEDKIKKLIVQKKDEIKQEVQKDFIEETKNGELRRERRIFWVNTVCQNFILNEIAKRIWEFRAHRLITKIRNRSARLIQKAYERYIFKKGNNKLLRNIVDIRQSLCFLSQMITKQAHKKATKATKTFLTEYPLLQMIAIKAMRFNVSVRKIQRMAKRHYVMRRFQKLVLSQMIQDMVSSANLVTEGDNIEDVNTLKNAKKGEKGKKTKSKPIEKEKEKSKMKDVIISNKQKNPLREQFDKALLISLDLRNIVVEAYLEEVIQQNKRKYRRQREKSNKLSQSRIQEEEKRDFYDEIDETNADNLKETCCTLVRISSGSTISQEDRNFAFETKESSLGNSTLINSQKVIGWPPASLKAISREGLSTFMDENYVGIAKNVKSKGDSKLLWLFN